MYEDVDGRGFPEDFQVVFIRVNGNRKIKKIDTLITNLKNEFYERI